MYGLEQSEKIMKLYVGNIPYEINEGELRSVFQEFGKVSSVKIVMDRDSRRSKGYGFIEMECEQEALAALSGLEGKEIQGRKLKVSKAQVQESEARRKSKNYRMHQ